MKKLFVIFFVISQILFGWGDKGHMLITEYAVRSLPSNMDFFYKYIGYIIAHSTDPDYRKNKVKDEAIRHFIDIDFYPNFKTDVNIKNYDYLVKKYTLDTVKKMGILPWATLETYNKLVQALKNNDTLEALIMISDLCHYVADGHQPQHVTLNYNGQLTGQKGVHSRYEITMFDKYELFWRNNLKTNSPKKITNNKLDFIFDYLFCSNEKLPIIMNADKEILGTNKNYSEQDYSELYKRTKDVTLDLLQKSIDNLSSLLYTAWIEAKQ
ncbi:MAG TPA: zinc dependent phospholipase C family protein [Ignavibacteriales bacterium]|nr:zinc dependent phospholipase C family protein [Ignavibacteriales bacterium]HOL81189.1 zinc dependent phospholipase C family protein [Ignavibacteriales bacterium]HOM65292.1 zinc dependent phospholipase C family protein [Ignavibacteriales bacterium]HPD68120.1 zinc dependent phospholipase C family protein [Ignavibacteriales bacterium]HPP33455.1 zinc dependent phospholipase C family protein [Ignavibacteriales bacterium]